MSKKKFYTVEFKTEAIKVIDENNGNVLETIGLVWYFHLSQNN